MRSLVRDTATDRTTGQHTLRRPPLGLRVLPRRVHYGWWITLGAAVLLFVGVGVGYYALAVFLRPRQEENGWSNAVVSGATGVYFSVAGVTAAIVGPRIDRRELGVGPPQVPQQPMHDSARGRQSPWHSKGCCAPSLIVAFVCSRLHAVALLG